MRLCLVGLGPKSNAPQKKTQTQTQGEGHLVKEAEMGVVELQGQHCGPHWELGRGEKCFLLRALKSGSMAMSTPWIRSLSGEL